MQFTREEKIQALRREIALRRNVYRARVDKGKMTQEQAEFEIAIMEEILQDYIRLTEDADIGAKLDAFLAHYSARPVVIPSRLIMESTGLAPRQIGRLMRERGWRPVWFSTGSRGWLSPEESTAEAPANSNEFTAEAPANSNEFTAEAPANSNAFTAEAPANSNEFTAEAPANSNAFTAEAPANSNEFTAEATADVRCDHPFAVLSDLAQHMERRLWLWTARNMAERHEKDNTSLCGRCLHIKNTILSTRFGFTHEEAIARILDVLKKKPDVPSPVEDPFVLIPEEVRAESDVVVEILNLLGGVASQAQLEKALKERGYKRPFEVLRRVQDVLTDFVEVSGTRWRIR